MKAFFRHSRNILLAWISCNTFLLQAQLINRTTTPQTSTATHCGSSWLLNNADPVKLASFEQSVKNRLLSRSVNSVPDTQHYTLPLVFHIIHQNGPENISDTDIRDAQQLLNDAFANLAPFNPATGVNTNIRFCLGSNAITRHTSPLTDMILESDDYNLKQIGAWNPTTHINIWVVNSITSLNMGPAVAGYAMFPSAHGSTVDGIVVEAAFIHNHPDDVKVLVHEMGHYLGLYHTFEGGCVNNDCTTDGDKVCDTPPDNSISPVPCTGSVNTCHTDSDDPSSNNPFRTIANGGLGDQPDMFQNYMDYGFQSCQNTFTDGQRSRMRSSLLNARASLLNTPNACVQCPTPIVASLQVPATVAAGVPVTFSVNTNQSGLLVIWQYNNQTQVGQSITETFVSGGTIPISVFVINSSAGSCFLELRDTITVTCPVAAPVFTANPAGMVSPGETISFSAPNNGNTYTWKIDGVTIGTGNTITYTVTGSHGRLLTLTASNGTCQATSEAYFIDPNNCSSSKENNTWYFGMNGGINFNTSPATAIQGKLSVEEGCSVLCDANGNAVFHSDGSSVGNSQTGMPLLNGTGLSGNTTTTQGALFVPMPGSTRYVYLFTVDYQAGDFPGFGGGIHYSLIDKQGNGGQGEVTVKNHLLTAPVTERVTAVKNLAGNGIWVIAHKWNSNAFYAWQVTASGVSAPVISYSGPVHNSPTPYSNGYSNGEMKASPSGKKLAIAMEGRSLTELYDFNRLTGVVSNPMVLQSSLINTNYGIAFSPNERFLYVSSISGGNRIVRFDLLAGNATAIAASCAQVGTGGGGQGGGAIQLAPNGKIYAARRGSAYLGVISNPNAANVSDCDYIVNGLKLFGSTTSFYGLPNPVQSSLLSVEPVIVGPDKICLNGSSQTVSYSFDPVGRATYSWIHRGPNTFTQVDDSTSTMTFSLTGTDTLIVKRAAPCGDSYDTLVIRSGPPQLFDIGPDKLVCRGTSVALDAGAGYYQYNWSNGGSNRTTTINSAGKVVVTVISTTGCVLKDSLVVQYHSLPSLNLGRDTSICTNETITLNAPPGMDSYLWNTGATGQSFTPPDSGSYIVTVGKFGCLFKDTIRIRKNLPLNIISRDTVVLCLGGSNLYRAPSGFDAYQWTFPDGSTSTNTVITIGAPGYYVLNYNNRCGSSKDSIYHYIPRFFLSDTLVSCADTIRVVSQLPLETFGSLSQQYNHLIRNADTIDVYRSGTYAGLGYYGPMQNGCLVMQYITVLVDTALIKPAKSVNLGPDVSYCPGNVLALNAGSGFDWYRWNTGAADSSTTVYGFGDYWVKAHYCGFDYIDSVHVSRDNSLTVTLGADRYKCPGGTVSIDAGSGYDWYNWNNHQQTQQISTSTTGTYIVQVGLNGCTASDTVMVYHAETTFTLSGDPVLCPGETLTLTASGSPGIQYLWDSLSVNAWHHTPDLPVTMPGTYHVKNAACPSSAWSAPFVVTAEVLPALVTSFNPTVVCPQDSVSISFNASAYNSYHWSDGSVKNPRKFIASGVPVLSVSGIKCSESYTISIPLSNSPACFVGIKDEGLSGCEQAYTLMPNPGNELVKLDNTCHPEKAVSVTISGAEGKIIGTVSGNLTMVNSYLNQLMQQLSPAVYALTVEDTTGRYHFKWIIIK